MHKNNRALITAVAVFMAAVMVCSCFAVVESDDASADKMENRNYEIFSGIDIAKIIKAIEQLDMSMLVPNGVSLALGQLPEPVEFPTGLDPVNPPEDSLVISGDFSLSQDATYTNVYICDEANIRLCEDYTITADAVFIQHKVTIDKESDGAKSAIKSDKFVVGGLDLSSVLSGTYALSADDATITASYTNEPFSDPTVFGLSLAVDATELTFTGEDGTTVTLANNEEAKAKALSIVLDNFDLSPMLESIPEGKATIENLVSWINGGMVPPKLDLRLSTGFFKYESNTEDSDSIATNVLNLDNLSATLSLGGQYPFEMKVVADAFEFRHTSGVKENDTYTEFNFWRVAAEKISAESELIDGDLHINIASDTVDINVMETTLDVDKNVIVIQFKKVDISLIIDMPTVLDYAASVLNVIKNDGTEALTKKVLITLALESVFSSDKDSVVSVSVKMESAIVGIKKTDATDVTDYYEFSLENPDVFVHVGKKSGIVVKFDSFGFKYYKDYNEVNPVVTSKASVSGFDFAVSCDITGLNSFIEIVTAEGFTVKDLPDAIAESGLTAEAEITLNIADAMVESEQFRVDLQTLAFDLKADIAGTASLSFTVEFLKAKSGEDKMATLVDFELKASLSAPEMVAFIVDISDGEYDGEMIEIDGSISLKGSISIRMTSTEGEDTVTTTLDIIGLDLSIVPGEQGNAYTAILNARNITYINNIASERVILGSTFLQIGDLAFRFDITANDLNGLITALTDTFNASVASKEFSPELPASLSGSVKASLSARSVMYTGFNHDSDSNVDASNTFVIGFANEQSQNRVKLDFDASIGLENKTLTVKATGKAFFDVADSSDAPAFEIRTYEEVKNVYTVANRTEIADPTLVIKIDSSADMSSAMGILMLLSGISGSMNCNMTMTDVAAWAEGETAMAERPLVVNRMIVTGASAGILDIFTSGAFTSAERVEVVNGTIPSGKWSRDNLFGYAAADIVTGDSLVMNDPAIDYDEFVASSVFLNLEPVSCGDERKTIAAYEPVEVKFTVGTTEYTIEYDALLTDPDQFTYSDLVFFVAAAPQVDDPVSAGGTTSMDITTDSVSDAVIDSASVDKLVNAANGDKTQINMTTGNDGKFSLTLDKADLDKIAGNGADFTVKAEAGSVSLDPAAMQKISAAAGSIVKLSLAQMTVDAVAQYVSVETMEKIGNAPVISINNSAGVHQLNGKMTFTVPYTQASADSQVVLYYLNTETGELEAVQTVYDPVAKTVTGTVDHMSYFTILEETSLGPVESIALFVIFVATMAVMGAVLVVVASSRFKYE